MCIRDRCADICDILTIAELDRSSLALAHVVQMLEAAHEMVRGALDVFLSRDVEAARKVCQADDNVDAMFSKIVLEVCGIITENPQNVMCDVDLIFITKYVERMEMCIRDRQYCGCIRPDPSDGEGCGLGFERGQ